MPPKMLNTAVKKQFEIRNCYLNFIEPLRQVSYKKRRRNKEGKRIRENFCQVKSQDLT